MIPQNAIYTGPPSREVIRFISALTMKDSKDRMFFRWGGAWRRLVTDRDYADLNGLVAAFKKRKKGAA